MTYERWQTLLESIRGKFTVTSQGTVELAPGPGHVEFVECVTPVGNVRLELEVRPKILEKKTYYSKRVGSHTAVEYRYDEHEHTLTLRALRQDESTGEWSEITAEALTSHL